MRFPDLSDTQVIVYTEYPGQAPQVIEDQVTYPLTTAMLTVPRSKVVRGFSFFGVSFVYVIFEDGTDIYWARSRVLEFLNSAASRLPAGVAPTIGPDATGVGWVYQYAVISKELNLSDTRTIQDWNLKFALAKAEGVAEVASVGGFVKQYNIILDPQRMRDLGISMPRMRDAIRASNADVGGRTVELSEFEYVIRGKGYLKGINDLGNIVLKASNGTPVLLRDVARVELGPDERRGITELNGEGEVASGIVLQRFGVNALDVIENVKKRFGEIASSFPGSVEIVAVYDRSNLINAAIETLKHTLLEESLVVALVCIVFLLHFRSALVAIVMLPVGILMAFGTMKLLGLGANIMSLGGIAIAIGAMIDAAIVMIENAHKHLERAAPGQSRVTVLIEAASEVGPALFFSLLIITVSFMPIFTLESQEGRLFSPLAFTKTFSMAAAALLSVTLVPALMVVCVRGRIVPEHKNPINRFLIWIYRPVIAGVMRARLPVILASLAVLAVTIWPARQLGSEFMPNLNEGTLLYMPTTLPGISVTKAAELLQTQDRIIRSFPEVASVYGKAGRASTATDPAPSEMFETIINLKPKAEWRPGVTTESLTAEMDRALQFPGVSNAWTMPIKSRIDMLSTGIRTPGRGQGDRQRSGRTRQARQADRAGLESRAGNLVGLCRARARRLLSRRHAGPRGAGALRHPDPGRPGRRRHRAGRPDRDHHGGRPPALFRQHALPARSQERPAGHRRRRAGAAAEWRGGAAGRGRQGCAPRAARPRSVPKTASSRSTSMSTSAIAISAAMSPTRSPAVKASIHFPAGSYVVWSGQYEYLERAAARLKIVVPVTLAIIFLLLYLNFRSFTDTMIVMLSLPFALVGGIWLMWWLGFNLSVAVVVGFIALAGVAAETGVVMLIYLNQALAQTRARCEAERRALSRRDLYDAIMEGAVERVRPKMMTVVAIMAGLLPIMWSTGTGSEIMQRIAVPMIGGMISSTLLTLIVIPAIYGLVRGFRLPEEARVDSRSMPEAAE